MRKAMTKSSRDIQLLELKDMITQLNITIKTLNDTIARQQTENDNLKAELAWFRQKMFGSSSERRTDVIAGQLSLFDTPAEEEKPVELIKPETVEKPRKSRRKKPTLKNSSRIPQPDRFWQIPCLRKIKSVLFVAVKC